MRKLCNLCIWKRLVYFELFYIAHEKVSRTNIYWCHNCFFIQRFMFSGTQLLTVQALTSSIPDQETPRQWHSMWEGPDDPMQYLHTLVAKTMALQVC